MFKEQCPHLKIWFSKLVIFSRNYSLHLNSNISCNVLYFLFDMLSLTISCWNTFLICKNDYLISIIIKFLQFCWNRLIPIYPILSIFSKFSSTFCINKSAVHIKSSNFFTNMGWRLTNYTTFYILPSPWR
jgi:hypothetical protein